MATMHVEVVSAESHLLSAEATELYARSVDGELGILPGHQPALIALDVGAVKVVLADGGRELIAVHRGVLFVDQHGKTIVLADIAERAGEIDVDRARSTKASLEQRLAGGDEDPVLRAALRRADLRLDVAASR